MQIQVEINDFSPKMCLFSGLDLDFLHHFSYLSDLPTKMRSLNLDDSVTGTNSFQGKQPKDLNAPAFPNGK